MGNMKPITEDKDYGHVTIGLGSDAERQIPIEDYVVARFDDREIQIITLSDNEGVFVRVSNPEGSNRSNQQMWLTEKSFISVFAGMSMYLKIKGLDPVEILQSSLTKDTIEYTFSDNLTDKFNKGEQ
jgi:hypothetical protein